jgi:hypothetical protein
VRGDTIAAAFEADRERVVAYALDDFRDVES